MQPSALLLPLLLLAAGPEDESLEDLLRRARAKELEVQATLRPRVDVVVQGLEGLAQPPDPGLLAALHAEIDALGGEVAPLLLPLIDPGPGAEAAASFRARQLTRALARLGTGALTRPLVELSETGSPLGRRHAIELLGRAPLHDERAHARLHALFDGDDATARRLAASALARRPSADRPAFLARALDDPDPELIGAVLAALAAEPTPDAHAAVLALCERPLAVAPWMTSLSAYLAAETAPLSEEDLARLVGLALEARLGKQERIALLGLFPALEAPWTSALEKRLQPLTEDGDPGLQEAALICLANLGDRAARRELVSHYDELVEQNEKWPSAYERRARLLLSIGEPRDAIRDFKRALELIEDQGRPAPPELWIDLARAYVRDKKLRQAYEVLQRSRLAPEDLRPLVEDEDFRPLREHGRYGRVFTG